MITFKNNILHLLQQMKGAGKFAYSETAAFVFPGLEVENIGKISFPVNEAQAQLLIDQARKAPFGWGTQTIFDSSVRSTHEIDPGHIKINNPQWQFFLDTAVQTLKEQLGLEGENIHASLYKLLIYEKGDFFLPHKDTEKEKGMFGTMVVELPSEYTGGELIIRYNGEEVVADFSNSRNIYGLSYTAFYADCEHEVKPLLSGYRICLVYNLIRENKQQTTQPLTVSEQAKSIAGLLKNETEHYTEKPFIFLLGHQYTPENFSYSSLKLNDRFKADALLKAAKLADCYAKLCLVTAYKTGTPEYDRYEDSTEIDEVIDEWLTIEHWVGNELPDLSNVSFEEEDLIASFSMEDDEPLIKESTGYMGNYGPDVEHWYHYGAVMIWSKEANANLLLNSKKETQLKWIDYFNQCHNASVMEKQAIRQTFVLDERKMRRAGNQNLDVIADWILHQNDFDTLTALDNETKQFYFEKISANKWLQIFGQNEMEKSRYFLQETLQNPKISTIERLLEVIARMFTENSSIGIARYFVAKISKLIGEVYHAPKNQRLLNTDGLKNLFSIEKYYSFDEKTAQLLVESSDRDYQNDILIPFLMQADSAGQLYPILFRFAINAVKNRVDNKPMEPRDFVRYFPEGTLSPPVLNEIRSFMQSPTESVFDFRKRQSDRDDMENGIYNLKLDLTTETIRKGTPYTLRITKNTASYQHALAAWQEDFDWLEKMSHKETMTQ